MKKVFVVSLVLLFALALLGLTFSRWHETLTVSGTVNTGEVDAKWSVGECYDSEPVEKDFSSIECWIDENDPKILHVEIDNAYLCITYTCEFDITNVGSIPIHVGEFALDKGNLPQGATVKVDYVGPHQIHPGDSGYGSLKVHLGNDAEENEDYEFTVSVEVDQWNE